MFNQLAAVFLGLILSACSEPTPISEGQFLNPDDCACEQADGARNGYCYPIGDKWRGLQCRCKEYEYTSGCDLTADLRAAGYAQYYENTCRTGGLCRCTAWRLSENPSCRQQCGGTARTVDQALIACSQFKIDLHCPQIKANQTNAFDLYKCFADPWIPNVSPTCRMLRPDFNIFVNDPDVASATKRLCDRCSRTPQNQQQLLKSCGFDASSRNTPDCKKATSFNTDIRQEIVDCINKLCPVNDQDKMFYVDQLWDAAKGLCGR